MGKLGDQERAGAQDVDKRRKTKPGLNARLSVNILLARAYAFIKSVEETRYLAQVPMDQMIEQAIRQLGADSTVQLSGQLDPVDSPPVGNTSRRARLQILKREFNDQLEKLKGLPDLSKPLREEDLLENYAQPRQPDAEKGY